MSLSEKSNQPIGGYFELELPRLEMPFPGALRFQSARAAFLALLRAGRPDRVFLPKHICNAMLAPLEKAGIECVWYDISESFMVDDNVKLNSEDWLLYVNYFGVCEKQVSEVLERFSSDRVVLDYSQSFFSKPNSKALATIYSPRKFFGVPDGGILLSLIQVDVPEVQDFGSIGRASHLIKRLGDSPESGYADYQQAEASLENCDPARMSKLTERILSSIDISAAAKRRRDNYAFLHKRLGHLNRLKLDLPEHAAPLCYPFLSDTPDLRSELIRNRIFVPTYWSEVIGRASTQWSERMVKRLLPLPVDQRYDQADMERVASIILGERA